MSIYGEGAAAFRDTTKWLVAFVPVASIVAAGVAIAPRLFVTDATEGSWWSSSWESLVGLLAAALGVVLVVTFGAKVLSQQPTNFTTLVTDGARLSGAFGAGVGYPYFSDGAQFRSAMAELHQKWEDGTPVPPAELARAVETTEMLREWALQNQLSSAFKDFRVWFFGGVALAIAGLSFSVAVLPPAAAIVSMATPVQVRVTARGAVALTQATGCRLATTTRFLAVGGSWRHPVLDVSGPGCRPGTIWQPSPQQVELQTSATAVPSINPLPGTGQSG